MLRGLGEEPHVGERIAVHDEQIRERARRDDAELAVAARAASR